MSVRLSRVVRRLVAVGLTAFVLWKAHPRAVVDAARGTSFGWIVAAVVLVIVDRALMAYRWVVLLRAIEPASRPPLSAIMRVFFVSTFVGTFLPSVGGDVYRAYSLARYDVSAAQSAASVLMDRVLGVASILLLGIVGIALAGVRFVDRGVAITLAAALLACAATALLIFSDQAENLVHRLLMYLPGARLKRIATMLTEATRRYAAHRRDLLNVLAGSVVVQVLRVVQAYYLGRALGIAAGPVVYFAFVPLILLIMLLPVTVNGLGTGQVAFVWFFAQAGVDHAAAFALSILYIALGLIGNLPGGLLYAFGGGEAPSRVS